MRRNEQFSFTVEGSGEFPWDMLRYDACWPMSEGHDSSALQHFVRDRRRVVLMTRNAHAPTFDRWASFNWVVVGIGELRDPAQYPTPTREQQERMRNWRWR